jgi:hypothetical protein
MRIRSRIERLEDELLPLPAGETLLLNIQGIDEEGEVVTTTVLKVPLPAPDRRGRRNRDVAARRDW